LVYLEPFNMKYDLSQPWLFNIESKTVAEIVINRTLRYHDKEEINWKILESYKERCVFIGTEKEHRVFEDKYGIKIKYMACQDALEFAQVIKGSRIYIGNQSMGFALAEAMKHPRILERYYGWDNCRPCGNDGYTILSRDILDYYLK
jgi:hypothetical protein